MSKGTRYDDEFKQMIVNLYNSGKSITELMSEYGVAKATLYKWINLYSPKCENVTTDALCKICKALNYDFKDIMEYIPE